MGSILAYETVLTFSRGISLRDNVNPGNDCPMVASQPEDRKTREERWGGRTRCGCR